MPVRAQLMRALWDIINRDDIIRKTKDKEQSAVVAFRILGKFGGENRSTIREAAKLNVKRFDGVGISAKLSLEPNGQKMEFALDDIIDATFHLLQKRDKIANETRNFAAQMLLNCFYTLVLREDEEHLIEHRVTCDFSQLETSSELARRHTAQILALHGGPDATSTNPQRQSGQATNFYFGRVVSGILIAMGQVEDKLRRDLKEPDFKSV